MTLRTVKKRAPVPSGCYLALHVDVFAAGYHIPGPLIQPKEFWGLWCYLV